MALSQHCNIVEGKLNAMDTTTTEAHVFWDSYIVVIAKLVVIDLCNGFNSVNDENIFGGSTGHQKLADLLCLSRINSTYMGEMYGGLSYGHPLGFPTQLRASCAKFQTRPSDISFHSYRNSHKAQLAMAVVGHFSKYQMSIVASHSHQFCPFMATECLHPQMPLIGTHG